MGLQDFQILARPLYSIMPTPIGYSVVAESPYPYNRWHSGIVKAWVEFGEGVSGMGILKALGGGGGRQTWTFRWWKRKFRIEKTTSCNLLTFLLTVIGSRSHTDNSSNSTPLLNLYF